MSEMTKIKKADNLSTLNDNDTRGRDEAMLKENTGPEISTGSDAVNAAIAPKMAKKFPHQFATWSFLLKTKEPNAPSNHKISAKKKTFEDVNRLNIFI